MSDFSKRIFSTKPIIFKIADGAWNEWDLNVNRDTNNQIVSLNGNFSNSAAGYVIESENDLPFAGKHLTINIKGCQNCSFSKNRLFKLEANHEPIKPKATDRINLTDQDYINAEDGIVEFVLPKHLKKLQFVFWDADLKNLKLSGTIK